MIQLSIIVPVYNKAAYLEACVKSILDQTFRAFEVILVNDGSTDGTEVICNRFAKEDFRVRVIYQANAGVSSARNRGLEAASGEYIGFIDADDTISSDMYQVLMRNIQQYDADVSVCRLQTISPGRTERPAEHPGVRVLNRREALAASLNGRLDRSANNKIYKREFARAVKFEGSIYEDILYTNRVFMMSNLSVVEDLVRYNYMVRDNSASMTAFGATYYQTVKTSAEILKMVEAAEPDCLQEAQAFDVLTNLSLLNLILLDGPEKSKALYEEISVKLSNYRKFIIKSRLLNKKQRYGLHLFWLSPRLYKSLLYLYGKFSNSDLSNRTNS